MEELLKDFWKGFPRYIVVRFGIPEKSAKWVVHPALLQQFVQFLLLCVTLILVVFWRQMQAEYLDSITTRLWRHMTIHGTDMCGGRCPLSLSLDIFCVKYMRLCVCVGDKTALKCQKQIKTSDNFHACRFRVPGKRKRKRKAGTRFRVVTRLSFWFLAKKKSPTICTLPYLHIFELFPELYII